MKYRYKIFPFVLSITVISLLIVLFSTGILYTIILIVGIAIILSITKSIWLPAGQGKYTVRILSVSVALTTAFSYGIFQNVIEALIKTSFPNIAKNYQDVPPVIVFTFIGIVLFFVNYYNRDKTGMGKHPDPLNKDLPKISYKDITKGIASSLSDDLRSIDIRTNWSSQYFTPLDAEIISINKYGKYKKIVDLLTAIRKSNERILLLLGDPGSGKSVALRKLCQELEGEVKSTGKIPIYVNLKEWQIDEEWTEVNPPTFQQLYNFVLSNICNRDIFISKFFNRTTDSNTTYFDRLYQSGRLFFVLDSFDEIPSVLNESEDSWLIQELSKVIFNFLKGSRLDTSQGILSSRLFRRPTKDFQTNTILEIRPFSELKIIQTFKRSGNIDDDLIKAFFSEQSHLIPIARNPFTTTLISEYIEKNNKLPSTHSQLYENYLDDLLENCKDRIKKKNLKKEKLLKFAQEIALCMYKGNQGWEVSIDKLRKTETNTDAIVDILRFSRIGRGEMTDNSTISFVHRRFAEYFTVLNLLENKIEINFSAIPEDSQLRDALVLYCEVADIETATSIAKYTWNIIKTKYNLNEKTSINSIRFLNDAFKSRKECIVSFQKDLSDFIVDQVKSDNNLLSIKFAVESVGLIEKDSIDQVISNAIGLDNYWISETAFYSCRNLPKISDTVKSNIFQFFNSISITKFLKNYSNYKFSLSLSESFNALSNAIRFKRMDFFFFTFALISSTILFPYIIFNSSLIFLETLLIAGFANFISDTFKSYMRFLPRTTYERFRRVFPFFFLGTLIPFGLSINDANGIIYSWSILNDSLWFNIFSLCSILFGYFFFLFKVKINLINYLIKIFSKKNRIKIITSIGVILIFILFMYLINYIFSDLVNPKFILFPIGILSLSYILYIIIRKFYSLYPVVFVKFVFNFFKDRQHYSKIIMRRTFNRSEIYEFYKSCRTEHFRSRFINFLEINVISINGDWPDKKFLKLSITKSHTRLMQLEEKWLGLNR